MADSLVTRIKLREDEDRAFILGFIRTYKSLPFLWDTTLKEYTDRNKKAKQYSVLLEKYREKYENAQKADVTKKINSLRTNFRRELKRITKLSQTESDSKFIEPYLWYFDELSFIKPHLNVSTAGQEDEDIQEAVEINQPPTAKQPKKHHEEPAEDLSDPLCLRIQNDSDNFKKMADIWANKLKSMSNIQQLYAEKFINEVLIEGLLGNLGRNAVQILPPSRNNHNPIVKPSNSLKSKSPKKNYSRNTSRNISYDYEYELSEVEEDFDYKSEFEMESETESNL